MKKSFVILLFSLSLIILSFSVRACAQDTLTKEYSINTVTKLKQKLNKAYSDGKMTKQEKAEISKQLDPNILSEFVAQKMEKANEVIAKADIDVDEVLNQDPNGESGSVELNLGDHCTAVIEFEDKEESELVSALENTLLPSAYAATNGETMWKSYGNRYFTAKKSVLAGIGTATIKLENHYKVSSNGLDERYGDPYVSFNFSAGITGSITAGNVIISDKTARTPGKSDINMYARFPYQYTTSAGGIAASSGGTFKLSTTVKYLAKNATSKKIKVKHSWSVTS